MDNETQNGTPPENGKISSEKLKMIILGAATLIIVLIVAVVVVGKMNAAKREEARKKARAERLHAALLKRAEEVKEAERRKWNLLVARIDTMRRKRQFDEAAAALKAFREEHQEHEYVALVDEELSKIKSAKYRIGREAKKDLRALKEKAAALISDGKFEQAARIYKNYSGKYAEETSEERTKLAEECLAQAERAKEKAKANEETAKNVIVGKIASMLVEGKFKTALSEFETIKSSSKVKDRDFLTSMETTLRKIAETHKTCIASYSDDINKKISVHLKSGGNIAGVLKRVSNTAVYIQVPKTKTIAVVKPIKFRDISLEEKFERVSQKTTAEAAAIYIIASAVAVKDYSTALEKTSMAGPFAGQMSTLISDLESLEEQKAAKAAETAAAKPAAAIKRPKPPPEKPKELIPPVMAAHKLYYFNASGQRKFLVGKTVVVTGIVSQITAEVKGTRLDLFNGKVVCYPKPMSVLSVHKFFKIEKRKKINRRYEYKDFFIKVTVKGSVRPTSKANAVELGDVEIINWYAVSVSGDGSTLKFSISSKPAGSSINAYLEPRPGEVAELEGYLTQGILKGAQFSLVLNKKLKTYIGNDPLSWATEARVINRIMSRKGFKGDLVMQFDAEVINRTMNLYKNARIKEWKSISDRVSLYKVPNYIDNTEELTENNAL